jgi:type IV pilus assembly protein PilO
VERNDRLLLLAGALGILLLGLLFYFLLFAPLRSEYAEAVEQRQQLEAQRRELEREVQRLQGVRRDAPGIQRRILEYSRRIPGEDEIDTLVVQIEEIGDASGVTWTSITNEPPAVPAGGGDYLVVPLTMSFEGDYAQLLDFLTRLKNLARLVTVNELTYEEVGEEEEGGTTAEDGDTEDDGGADTGANPDLLRVEIVAETYVQPTDEPAAGATPQNAPAEGTPGGATTPAETTTGGTTAGGG